jgi:hypothetical protein
MRPRGLLFIDTPNIYALGHHIYGRYWRGLEAPRHLVIFNARALRNALKTVGFTDIRRRRPPQPFALLSVVSACFERGQDYTEDVDTSELRLPTPFQRLTAYWTRRRSEFLTLVCRKGANLTTSRYA